MNGGPDSVGQDLALFEQVHTALGLANKLDDFYTVLSSLLVDPGVFGFSHAQILRVDEVNGMVTGRLALGAKSIEEHGRFREQLGSEAGRIGEMIEAVQIESPEPHAIQALLNLRFHALWIQLLQSGSTDGDGTSMNSDFLNLAVRPENLSTEHPILRAMNSPRAFVVSSLPEDDPLAPFVRCPAVAGRLLTRRGVHALVMADRAFEPDPLDELFLVRFQSLLNLASVALDNVELVEELTETTRKLQEMDRMKANFLSIVSHELRTPLTSILGFVSLVADQKIGPLTSNQQDLLKRVVQHSMHLQDMVNDLLEIAEAESGGMISLTQGPVDGLAVLMNIIPRIESRRSAKRPRIEPIIGESGAPLCRADARALDRILFHLIDNAVKFSTGDEAKVDVEFRSDGNRVEITVSDHGIGISPEHLKQIWNRFYQVDYRLERAYGGMGIGLNIVKMLLDATGGQIRVESTVGVGSRFTISYPLATRTSTG